MKVHCSATTFTVNQLEDSLRFYLEVLGFEEDFRFGSYAGLKLGPVLLHLSQAGNPNSKPPGSGSVYIFCDEVDAYHAEIVAKGAAPQHPPKDYEYGMRDFVVADPDGNLIAFGMESQ
jgi:catechol 2,3-dioxygenase-like lactoylglutathione lyase family enzyme